MRTADRPVAPLNIDARPSITTLAAKDRRDYLASRHFFILVANPVAGRSAHTTSESTRQYIYQLRMEHPSPEARRLSATRRERPTSLSWGGHHTPKFHARFVSLVRITLVDTRRYVGDKTRRVSSARSTCPPSVSPFDRTAASHTLSKSITGNGLHLFP